MSKKNLLSACNKFLCAPQMQDGQRVVSPFIRHGAHLYLGCRHLKSCQMCIY